MAHRKVTMAISTKIKKAKRKEILPPTEPRMDARDKRFLRLWKIPLGKRPPQTRGSICGHQKVEGKPLRALLTVEDMAAVIYMESLKVSEES